MYVRCSGMLPNQTIEKYMCIGSICVQRVDERFDVVAASNIRDHTVVGPVAAAIDAGNALGVGA